MLPGSERNIIVANKISRLLGILSLFLLITLVASFGYSVNTPIILALALFFFSIPYLHQSGYGNLGRVLLCLVPTVVTLAAALLAKIYSKSFTDILYYDSRFVLLLLTIVPCLIFDTAERAPLYGSLGIILLSLLLFDPIHEFFHVGYFQKGFDGRSYYFINYFTIVCFLGIAAGAISQKRVIEETERQNFIIKSNLADRNMALTEALNDLEAQHEEILSQNEEIVNQREELLASREQLVAAHRLIEKQKVELQRQVIHINDDLKDANEELIRQNNNIRQFSFTISHNLRGPIARLLGLAYLAERDTDIHNRSTLDIIGHIKTSAAELDMVIRDLNRIIDFQNAVDQLRRPVDFNTEWGEVKSVLHISDEMEAAHFSIDFSVAPMVVSVKPMINSILYNLVSNSLKYQSPDRPLQIIVRTYRTGAYTTMEVGDNGLGINLELFKNDIFKMYRRFHDHVEGKGVGLYLVKVQAEALNGYAEVASAPDQGATFKIHVKSPVLANSV